MDENKICTPLISILKYLFDYTLLPIAIYKLIQIYYKWNFIIRIEIFSTHLWLWNMVYSDMQSFKLLSAISKTCYISNSGEQKYISQMFAIDIYV